MKVSLEETGASHTFTLIEDDQTLAHSFPSIGLYKSQDVKAYLANQLQRAIGKWNCEYHEIPSETVAGMMKAIFSE